MKITIIGPVYPYRGGIAHYTTGLCQELIAAGHEVQVVSFKRQYPGWLYPGQSDKDPSLQHEQTPALYTLDPFYFWTWLQAIRQIANFRPDLILIQWWTTFWAPAFFILSTALKRRGFPCIFNIHNVMPHEKRPPDVLLSRLVLSQGSAFITLSSKEGERLVGLIPSARVYASHLPVPKVTFPAEGRAEIRRVMGFAPDQPVLLFFGIVRAYKGLHVLLDALASLPDKAQPPHLLVVGEFWEAVEEYQSRVDKLAIADWVTIENRYVPNEELARFFTAADAFVAPYISGTQSAAVKMAMSYRLPILASDQISSDLPVDTYPVYIHHAGDACDLSRSIQEFLDREPGIDAEQPVGGDWSEIVSLIEQIGSELSPARSRGPRSGNP